jgi:hypothetical protein
MRVVTLFEEQAFASANGNPFLTMHKVGDLPKGANRPQLYVSLASLRRLLVKFRRHGFQSVLPSALTTPEFSKCFTVSFPYGYYNDLLVELVIEAGLTTAAKTVPVLVQVGAILFVSKASTSTANRLFSGLEMIC